MVKELHRSEILVIALDLCQPLYQNLLINYLKILAENVEIKTENLSVSLKSLHNKKKIYICKECRKKQLTPINWLIKNFSNTYKFYNNDINKFILLLRKVYL